MSYRVEIGSRADAQLAELDSAIGASVERKTPPSAPVSNAKFSGSPKMPQSWFTGGSWECPMTWPVSVNFVSVTGGFFTGFITAKKSSASIESSIAPRFTGISDSENPVCANNLSRRQRSLLCGIHLNIIPVVGRLAQW